MRYNVNFLLNCRTVLYHPDAGTASMHPCSCRKRLFPGSRNQLTRQMAIGYTFGRKTGSDRLYARSETEN